MFDDIDVAVVIPAYNEGDHVGETIETVPGFVDLIVPVDDASSDDTWTVISRYCDAVPQDEEHQRLLPLRHDHNRGVGAAITTGYTAALEAGVDVIAVMAGDGQMDPDHLPSLIEPVASGRVGYAKGNRLHRPADYASMSRWRLFGNGVLTMLTRLSTGYWEMTDPQNGYTVISSSVLERIPYESLYDRYGFANDLLAVLNSYEIPIADVSHPAVYADEESSIRYRSFVPRLSWLLLRRFVWRLYSRYLVRGFHPLVPTYAIGVIGVILGSAGVGYATIGGVDQPMTAGFLAVTIFLLGCISLILAMWFDVQANDGLVEHVAPTASADDRSTRSPAADYGLAVSDGGRAADTDGPSDAPSGEVR